MRKSSDEYWNGPKGEEHRKSASERKKQWNKDHPEEAAMIQASAIDGIRESWANDDGTMRQRASDTSTARYVDDQEREKQSVRLKEYCASLTEEEMCGRLDNSLRNCDHKKRGDAISKGKRGKSNNQQENMGRKYASWSDEEFNELLTRYTHQHVIDRTIRLRDKWKEIIRLESLKD
jgi:hypothetical protein